MPSNMQDGLTNLNDASFLGGDRTAACAELLLPEVPVVRAKTTVGGFPRTTEVRKGGSHRFPSLVFPSPMPFPGVVKK